MAKRAGTPDEVAAVGALLMGPDGGFITGSDFRHEWRRDRLLLVRRGPRSAGAVSASGLSVRAFAPREDGALMTSDTVGASLVLVAQRVSTDANQQR